MEGSRGRRISMVVVVVAILVGLSSIHVGAAMGPSNCGAYAGFCFDTPQCCNSVRTLVTEDVPCFCTAIEGIDVTLIIQPIKETCGITIRPDICSNAAASERPQSSPTNSRSSQKNEAFRVTWAMMPKWAVGLMLLCMVTTIIL